MSRIIPIATLALAVSACSAASAGQWGLNISDAQTAQVGGACASMGLKPSQVQYEDCTIVLGRSVEAQNAAAETAQARAACVQSGGQPGTPQFANCILDHENVPRN